MNEYIMLYFVLDAIGSPNTYPCQSVGQWVIDSFRFGDSYRISELCKLVYLVLVLICSLKRDPPPKLSSLGGF